ncbi:MAG: trigger factor [Chloroflexi bacterium RBG_16_72_14]|nr:MAG: trigger factor [Chloroflexi bacterium RBG_16_72_14]
MTATPAPKSSVLLEIEVPADRLDRAVRDATGRLSRRTRVAGFRPGKAPRPILERVLGPGAVLDEAVDHLVQDAYREALREQGILPLTNADVEVVQAEEGKPLVFKATVQVRPEVALGDYASFNFTPEIETVDDAKVDKVVEELRDQNATLAAVEDRGARDGDWAIIGFAGTRDGVPFDGGTTERMPLILGEERLIPGFEANLVGLRPGESAEFDITFPDDYPEESLAGQQAHFAVDLKELREKVLPEADDDFARNMGDYADLAKLKAEVGERLRRNALDRARHEFSDRIIDYAVANATLELPDVLIDQEVEVMHDEFRSTLARQGIAEPAYLKATDKSEAHLHAEFRPRAEQRTKVLLVLSRIAEAEGIEVPEADVEAEIDRARRRYQDPKTIRYFESERGRNFIRSSLRRTRVVEGLVDRWLAANPDYPALPHLEDDAPSAVDAPQAEAAAAIDATDPGIIPGAETVPAT